MAITEMYANFSLATGSNDGTSEADAWQTVSDLVPAAGERINIKTDGTRETAAAWAISTSGSATQPIFIRGYSSTIGDDVLCKLTASVASALNITGDYVYFTNIDYEHTGGQWDSAFAISSDQGGAENCKFLRTITGASNNYVVNLTQSSLINCYVEGRANNSAASAVLRITGSSLTGVAVKALNGQAGIIAAAGYATNLLVNTLVYSSVSTTLAGIEIIDMTNVAGLTIDSFTIDGFDEGLLFDVLVNTSSAQAHVSNGVISGAVDAITTNEATARTGVFMSDIAFYNNTNDYSGMGDNVVNKPIACTADPYEDSANGDFRPNTTASGGALLQAAAGFAAGEFTSGRDIGALQHADPAGGGGGGAIVNQGLHAIDSGIMA